MSCDLNEAIQNRSPLNRAIPYMVAMSALLFACDRPAPPVPAALTYYRTTDRGRGSKDHTEALPTLAKHTLRDSITGHASFNFQGVEHEVTGWTDDHYAPTDGGSFWLDLDSLGEIFGRSTTWPGFSVVHTNSDSVNQLISFALAAASRPSPFGVGYPPPPQPKIETVQFMNVAPVDK